MFGIEPASAEQRFRSVYRHGAILVASFCRGADASLIMRLPLKFTIAAMTTIAVAIVAGVSLGITLEYSLSSLRVVGTSHMTAVLLHSSSDANLLFSRGVSVLGNLRNMTALHNWTYPSDDDTAYTMWVATTLSLLAGSSDIESITMYFADNTKISAGRADADVGHFSYMSN
jgi:hypothetical protein